MADQLKIASNVFCKSTLSLPVEIDEKILHYPANKDIFTAGLTQCTRSLM